MRISAPIKKPSVTCRIKVVTPLVTAEALAFHTVSAISFIVSSHISGKSILNLHYISYSTYACDTYTACSYALRTRCMQSFSYIYSIYALYTFCQYIILPCCAQSCHRNGRAIGFQTAWCCRHDGRPPFLFLDNWNRHWGVPASSYRWRSSRRNAPS
jgi:hypothetical protein